MRETPSRTGQRSSASVAMLHSSGSNRMQEGHLITPRLAVDLQTLRCGRRLPPLLGAPMPMRPADGGRRIGANLPHASPFVRSRGSIVGMQRLHRLNR